MKEKNLLFPFQSNDPHVTMKLAMRHAHLVNRIRESTEVFDGSYGPSEGVT